MEKDRHRLATCGTKYGQEADCNPSTEPEKTARNSSGGNNSNINGASASAAEVLDVTDCTWKQPLVVGNLVDVRDPSQVWYQVSLETVYVYVFASNVGGNYVNCFV